MLAKTKHVGKKGRRGFKKDKKGAGRKGDTAARGAGWKRWGGSISPEKLERNTR